MLNDQFVEQIIKRKITFSAIVYRMLMLLLCVISVFSIVFIGSISIAIIGICIYFTYVVFKMTSVEYEYSFLNGDLTIDKIMGQSRRKHLTEVDIKSAAIVAPIDNEEVQRAMMQSIESKYITGNRDALVYGIVLANETNPEVILIEPNEKLIDAMHYMRPNIVKK